MKNTIKLGCAALVAVGFLAATVSKAEINATPASDSSKKASGWSQKSKGKTFKKYPAQKKEIVKWVCPMQEEFVGDKPGKCPKCGMNLEKKVVVVAPAKKTAPVKK
jgi:rubrerythrin